MAENDMDIPARLAPGYLFERPLQHDVDGVPLFIAPEGFSVHDLSQYRATPARQSGRATIYTPESFVAYAKEGKSTDGRVYVDERRRQFTAVLNHGDPAKPGWRDHCAIYEPKYELEYSDWLEFIDKGAINQIALIKFLEDRYRDITSMEPAEMLSLVRNFKVASTGSITSALDLHDGTTQIHYTHDNRGSGDIEIPEVFVLGLPIFEGTDAIEIPVRFRYRHNEGALTFFLEIAGRKQLERDEFRKINDAIRKDLKTWTFFEGTSWACRTAP